MSKLQHFLERSHHNLNFVKIWPEKQIFWGVALVQVQWLRTVTRYGLDNLKQCCKRIKTKSQKILRTNCVDVELAWENQPGGLYESRSKELSLREKCPNTEFFLVRIFPLSDWIRTDTPYLSVFSPNAAKCGPEKNSVFGQFSRSEYSYNFRPSVMQTILLSSKLLVVLLVTLYQ